MKATLGGFPLLASAPVRWTLREGTLPHSETFDMRPDDAQALLTSSAGKPINLSMEVNGKTVVITKLYLLHAAPQDQPQIAKVTVADRRWIWPNNHIDRSYNMRRNIGVRRTTNYDSNILDPVVPQVWYWPWSTKDGAGDHPWLAKEVLQDVLAEIVQGEKDWNGNAPDVLDLTPDTLNQIPIENLELKDNGANALQRVLTYLPGIAVRIDPDGRIVVYDKTKGGESDTVKALGPEVVGGGHVTLIDNRILRPKKVVVMFQREVEVRFDAEEVADGQTTATNPEGRGMDNMGQVTDANLVVKGGPAGGYPEGTWQKMNSLLNTFNELGSVNGMKITPALIRKAFCPFGPSLWERFAEVGTLDTQGEWSGRIAMIQRCYRQVYAIYPRFLSRMLTMRAYRVSTVDQASARRAGAPVYADHAILPSDRALLTSPIDAQYYVKNVSAWAGNKPAPAFVDIIDADQGIIGVRYQIDPLRMNEMVLPSKVENPPNGDIRFPLNASPSFDAVCSASQHPSLTAAFKLSVILTCVPASPNTDQKLHRIEVEPSDVQASVAGQIGECVGPVMEVYVGPNVTTAKVMWNDSRSADIEKCFGIGVGLPNLDGLVLNDTISSPTAGASLNNIAHGIAAQIYATLIDRPQGQQSGHLNGDVKIQGYVESVSHEISTQGVGLTKVTLPGQIPKLSLASYLDPNSRAAIFHLAQPTGAA